MTLEEAEKVTRDYGEHLKWVGGYNYLFCGKVPQSLLPRPKKDILEALRLMETRYINSKDSNRLQTVHEVMSNLVTYVDDEEALLKASERWGKDEWRKHFVPSLKQLQKDLQDTRDENLL